MTKAYLEGNEAMRLNEISNTINLFSFFISANEKMLQGNVTTLAKPKEKARKEDVKAIKKCNSTNGFDRTA